MIIHNPILTGSFTVNGTDVASITSSAASITAINAYTASQDIRNGTYATTGSNTFKNPQTINSNLIVTGSITAATLVVQTITSSVIYSSGSNVFGNNIANTQVMTGSLLVTGSSHSIFGNIGIGETPSSAIGWSKILTLNGNGLGDTAYILKRSGSSQEIAIGTDGSAAYFDVAGNVSGSNNTIRFRTGATGSNYTVTERMRITSDGNVGIGTSSPSGSFHVQATNSGIVFDTATAYTPRIKAAGALSDLQIESVGNGGNLIFSAPGTTSIITMSTNGSERMRITSGGRVGIGQTAPGVQLSVAGQSDTWQFGVTTATGTAGGLIGSPSANVLAFGDWSGTERMRITSGGGLVINETTQSNGGYFLQVGGNNGGCLADAKGNGDANYYSTSTTIGYHIYGDQGSGAKFYVVGGGQIYSTSTSISAISDIRHKENIIDLETGLNKILALKPRRFDWKEGKGTEKKNVAGFIAQEVEEIFPDLIDDWKETMGATEYFKSIRMTDLIPTLVKAIQELQAQITELKNK